MLKWKYRAKKRTGGGSSSDQSRTFLSMPKADKRNGLPFVRVLLADGVLGKLDLDAARVSLDFGKDDDERWMTRVVSSDNSDGVKVRRPASGIGRTRIDVAVPEGLSISITKRAELRFVEYVDGLPVFAIPAGVSIEELEG